MKQDTATVQKGYFEGEGLDQYEHWFKTNYRRRLENVIRSNNTELVINELKKAIGLAEYLKEARNAEKMVYRLGLENK